MKTQGNVAGDPLNSPTEKPIRTRSRFPSLSYRFFNTERFGEYDPCFVMDCVEGDSVPIRSGGRVSSYSLKAPLMQSIFKKKDFYMVPMEAILPKNWQKFYTNPTVGDDVPDDCGTGVEDFWKQVGTLVNDAFTITKNLLADANSTDMDIIHAVLRSCVLSEYFYSSGSLLKSLHASGDRYFKFSHAGKHYSLDSWFDLVMAAFRSTVPYFEFTDDGVHSYTVVNDVANYDYLHNSQAVVSFRSFLQMLRDDLTTHIVYVPSGLKTALVAALSDFFDTNSWQFHVAYAEIPYDIRRLWAYQLVVSHFYTNDHIDFIYSADIFRQLIDYIAFTDTNGAPDIPVFTYNGTSLQYDSMSAYVFEKVLYTLNTNLSDCLTLTIINNNTKIYYANRLGYMSNLFSYRRSLRFVDYFTGSRSRPLAVGDVNVNVNANLVNIVDVSRNIQRQRFFNAVNRFGRKFEEYIKGLSGITPAVDYHNPLYLAHVSDTVYGVEVENTGAAQVSQGNSITSRFQTNGSRYQFEFSVDRPCVVIGLGYYDMPRAYISATERQLFYMNRFDMFNPFMQFIGDQAVNFAELGAGYVYGGNPTFGYQLRHMEYKQRYDQAAGGFVESLPGFLFTDRQFGELGSQNITPNFIRSLNSELDDFYVSMTGYSLGHYFHFIVENDNVCDASRPMAFAPSIL